MGGSAEMTASKQCKHCSHKSHCIFSIFVSNEWMNEWMLCRGKHCVLLFPGLGWVVRGIWEPGRHRYPVWAWARKSCVSMRGALSASALVLCWVVPTGLGLVWLAWSLEPLFVAGWFSLHLPVSYGSLPCLLLSLFLVNCLCFLPTDWWSFMMIFQVLTWNRLKGFHGTVLWEICLEFFHLACDAIMITLMEALSWFLCNYC